jgi:hypothetical protein
MSEQRCHLVIGKIEARHSFIKAARMHQRGDFRVGVGSHKAEEGRSTVGPVAVAPVADSAAVREGSNGRRRLLRSSSADNEKSHAKKSLEHRCTLPASATTRSASIPPSPPAESWRQHYSTNPTTVAHPRRAFQ